jgi:hypothetical protein
MFSLQLPQAQTFEKVYPLPIRTNVTSNKNIFSNIHVHQNGKHHINKSKHFQLKEDAGMTNVNV